MYMYMQSSVSVDPLPGHETHSNASSTSWCSSCFACTSCHTLFVISFLVSSLLKLIDKMIEI